MMMMMKAAMVGEINPAFARHAAVPPSMAASPPSLRRPSRPSLDTAPARDTTKELGEKLDESGEGGRANALRSGGGVLTGRGVGRRRTVSLSDSGKEGQGGGGRHLSTFFHFFVPVRLRPVALPPILPSPSVCPSVRPSVRLVLALDTP